VIKTEKELLRLIWKEMGLGGHNSDMKKRIAIAKEVHQAVEFGFKDCPPGNHEEMLDAIAELFLSRIVGMKEETFTKALYTICCQADVSKDNLHETAAISVLRAAGSPGN
jgi:hypothetical protein